MYKKYFLVIIVFTLLFGFDMFASAQMPTMVNPALEHCEKLGYEYEVVNTSEGQVGMCKVSDDKKVSAWDFLQGKIELEENFCTQNGYESKITDEQGKCDNSSTKECVLCVLENGKEIEMMKLIAIERPEIKKLDCNFDGKCSNDENVQNCPDDCLAKKLEIAPKQEAEKFKSVNDEKNIYLVITIIFLITLLLIGIMIVIFRNKKRTTKEDEYPESHDIQQDVDSFEKK